MSKTAQGLIDFAKSKVGTPYVYGAKGELMTEAKINQLRNMYGSGMVWWSDNSKAGKVCVDCSGLISWYTGIMRGSSQYKSTAAAVVPISQRTNEHIGWAVWVQGHIGIYLGNDTYIAADGSAYGVRIAKLSQNRFTHLLKLCDIDYGQGAAAPAPVPTTNQTVHADYAVMISGGRKLPSVRDCQDYAGIPGKCIVGLIIKCSKGYCRYRVYLKGKGWLPYVDSQNANWSDPDNGWAGDGRTPVDAVEVYYYTPDDIRPYKRARYRVSPAGSGYYDWQYDNEKDRQQDGYAGAFGKAIDRFQISFAE